MGRGSRKELKQSRNDKDRIASKVIKSYYNCVTYPQKGRGKMLSKGTEDLKKTTLRLEL